MGDICYIYFRIECVKINKDLKFRFSRVIKPDICDNFRNN